ncbi:butyrophilin subfamily 1 member A1-like [Halichoeres trimaculatus]|uniref:butyrophilin subfamily 1 member A1-like n=1 Tax=Halichoeres trimaculatus TaxID=147232 RepID=UPI003D9F9973
MKCSSVAALLITSLPWIFLLLPSFGAQTKLICPEQPIKSLAGDDVILTCQLHPSMSASSETVVWTKPGLDPKYVYFHKNGKLRKDNQNPSYSGRTRLSEKDLVDGKVSLEIRSVKISDEGEYWCILESMQTEASVQLSVGAVSEPFIGISQNNSGDVALQCRCEGWYPEPELMWLDGEGNPLPAENKDTFRHPDGLFSVSSRLTVTQRNSHSFTCRVCQEKINKTRETTFYLPANCSSQNCHYCIWCPFVSFIVVIISIIVTYKLTKNVKGSSFKVDSKDFNHPKSFIELPKSESESFMPGVV